MGNAVCDFYLLVEVYQNIHSFAAPSLVRFLILLKSEIKIVRVHVP